MVRIMAELDYAFIAEFAKVEGGKLTAIGASYMQITPPAFPVAHYLSVAGRIRAPEDTETGAIPTRTDRDVRGSPGRPAPPLERS
jgi:hypothetical protein